MSYPVAARALLRDTLLDATGALLSERPWAKVSMGDVAARAGVSRQTLYNELGGRRELGEAFVRREAERLLEPPERELAAHAADPRAAIAAATRAFLEAAAGNRLVLAMTVGEDAGLLALVTTRDAVLSFAAERLFAVLEHTWPGLPATEARALTENVVRLAISHATLPTATPAATARALTDILGPRVDQLLLSASSRAA